MNHQEMSSDDARTILGAPQWITRSQERAHAMKNRVAAIRVLARLAARHTSFGASGLAGRLEQNVCELGALVDEVVGDSLHSEHPDETVSLSAVEVPALFEVVESRLGARAAARGVELRFDCAPGRVRGIACDLVEAMHNLISNALEATPEGGVVTVSTRVTDLGEHMWTVEDSGHGIPPEVLASVSTHRCSRRSGGTGLGLAIAAATVGRHGGVLEASARAGGGTRMTAWLPAAPVA